MMRVSITGVAFSAALSRFLSSGKHRLRLDHVRIELDLKGCVGGANFGYALNLAVAARHW